MPRINRGALEQGWFHVLNRGNHRQQLFHAGEDYAAFIGLLAAAGERLPVKIWGYCLMPNHWHLVIEVARMPDLSKWVHGVCNRHVRLVHRENPRLGGGHIYQGRYKSFPIQDENYLYTVLRYVEANPLRARLVTRAEDWPWSSLSRQPIFDGLIEVQRPKLAPWPRGPEWLEEVNHALPAEKMQDIRQSVQRGKPLGDAGWLAALTSQGGLASTVRPRGRPRKIKPTE
jgi:putative transposase